MGLKIVVEERVEPTDIVVFDMSNVEALVVPV